MEFVQTAKSVSELYYRRSVHCFSWTFLLAVLAIIILSPESDYTILAVAFISILGIFSGITLRLKGKRAKNKKLNTYQKIIIDNGVKIVNVKDGTKKVIYSTQSTFYKPSIDFSVSKPIIILFPKDLLKEKPYRLNLNAYGKDIVNDILKELDSEFSYIPFSPASLTANKENLVEFTQTAKDASKIYYLRAKWTFAIARLAVIVVAVIFGMAFLGTGDLPETLRLFSLILGFVVAPIGVLSLIFHFIGRSVEFRGTLQKIVINNDYLKVLEVKNGVERVVYCVEKPQYLTHKHGVRGTSHPFVNIKKQSSKPKQYRLNLITYEDNVVVMKMLDSELNKRFAN